MNEHVVHLAGLVDVGTVVKVVRRLPGPRQARNQGLLVQQE
jgi:hypothetical protein